MNIREFFRRLSDWIRGEGRRPSNLRRALIAAPSHSVATPFVARLSEEGVQVDAVEGSDQGAAGAKAVKESRSYDIVLVIDKEGGELEQTLEFAEAVRSKLDAPVVMVDDARTNDELLTLLSNQHVHQILALSQPSVVDWLGHTVTTLLEKDRFPFDAFSGGAPSHGYKVTSSRQRDALVNALRDFTAEQGVHRRIAEVACGVADEFIMNAVYNAPVDESGERLYRNRDRTEHVDLPDGDGAEFRFACDGKWLAIAITDPFGSLTDETLRDYLVRCLRGGDSQIEQKAGGAGLGLYQILRSVNAFIVNIVPGSYTEMIGLLSVDGSFRQFARQPKSILISVQDSQGQQVASASGGRTRG